ncbi:MAG: gluconate 2-dehydrogenase subunit 3 family protein [Synoicihabitans sp.]
MNRRDALKSLLALSGSVTVFGADKFLAGEHNTDAAETLAKFTPELLALLDEIAETIIPATPDSGGAKAAGIAAFMQEIVTDHYTAEERALFFPAAPAIDTASRETHDGRSFRELTAAEREAHLLTYETRPQDPGYVALKQLTVWGYFTSEVGQTEALAYDPVPQSFQGDLPLKPGQKAWN